MIERNLAVISNRTRRGNLALRNDLRNSFRLERVLEKNSLALKRKLVEERNRTLKGLALRSKQEKKGKKGGVEALGLLGGGLLGRKIVGRRIPKIPKLPTKGGASLSRIGKVGRFGRIGPLAVLGTGLDFAGRKAEGQTNLQAGLGAGGGLAGALAGGKAGAILGTAIGGPVGTLVGGIGGSIIGGLAGGRLADIFSGADRRRKFEERRVEISTQKSLFSGALDDLDRVLDKLEETSIFSIPKKQDDDGLPERRFPFGSFFPKPKPDTPFLQQPLVRNIGYTALATGLLALTALAVGSSPGTPEDIPLVLALKSTVAKSPFLMKVAKVLRFAPAEKPLETLVIGKQIPGISKKGLEIRGDKILRDLGTFVKKQVKVTKGRVKIKNRKILRNQDKVTFSDKKNVQELIKLSKEANKKQVKIIKKYNMNREKNINPKKKKFSNKAIRDFINKEGNLSPDSPLYNLFNKSIKKSDNLDVNSMSNDIALAPTNNIFLINQDNSQKSSPPQIQGGDTIVIGGNSANPYDAAINIAQMEVLQTV